MRLTSGDLRDFGGSSQPVVVTPGNFDGLHRGHRHLIQQVVKTAQRLQAQAMVITFQPHPQEYFSQNRRFPLLRREERVQFFEDLGIDWLHEQSFDGDFSKLEPESFLTEYLDSTVDLKKLYLGYDYRFGRQSRGDYDLARSCLGKDRVARSEAFEWMGEVVSSTSIREALLSCDVVRAESLLGYSYAISGQVTTGQALGRKLGFPTANLDDVVTCLPGPGVYAGYVSLEEHRPMLALMNIGYRPTVSDALELRCECHILDFSENIYGHKMKFQFKRNLRSEMKFDGLDELKQQIQLDITKTRKWAKEGL